MAKFGEGDDRWIVSDRADGTNVNGWHWVENDCMNWTKHRLDEMFKSWKVLDEDGKEVTFTGLDSATGEAIINNRKQKIIPSYELEIKINWEGQVNGQKAVGKIHIPYLADENHDDDADFRFVLQTDDAASNQLKQAFLQGPAKKAFLERIAQFVTELRSGGPALKHNQAANGKTPADTTTSTANGTSATSSQSKPKLSSADPSQVKSGAQAAGSKSSGKSGVKSLKLKEDFFCRPGDIFECFMHEGRIRAFTQSAATVQPQVGGTFSWFGGSVQGTFRELEPGKSITMDWRFSSWQDGCTSKAVITLEEPEPGHTILKLNHTNIPEADKFGNEDVFDNVEKGWKLQIFQRIRQVFGFGVGL